MTQNARLFLIRHACPEGDYSRRFLGSTDPALGKTGRAQARRLGKILCAQKIPARVLSSPLCRAQQTAELAFESAVTIRIEPLATEIDFGCVDGLIPEVAERMYPEAYRHYQRNAFSMGIFGGENWQGLSDRAASLGKALSRNRDHALVSHQFFLLALTRHLLGADTRVAALGYAECLVLERHADGRWQQQQSICADEMDTK